MAELTETLRPLRSLDGAEFERLVTEKLRPPYDYHGLVMLRERTSRERDLRELYRGRAPYELLQNADDVGATRAVFVLTAEGLAFLHDGSWFTVRNFESLALGWSDKDPNICIGNKGLGFRSVLDATPSPQLFRVGDGAFFGVKFSYALNNGHIRETLNRKPRLRAEVRDWGPYRSVCPVMSIPGTVQRQSLARGATSTLDRANRNEFGDGLTTFFWLPATDADIPPDVLHDLGPRPLTTSSARDELGRFVADEVSGLILFLQHIGEVRLYEEFNLTASVTIPARARRDSGEFSVLTDAKDRRQVRTFFQVRKSVQIPQRVREQPETSRTLRAMKEARVAVSAEIIDGRPAADPAAQFHVYFPTEEKTGVGFVIHGDFYVKPDRTRLMVAPYNEWLFAEAAALAAGPFLDGLLARSRPRDVFATLRPMTPRVSDSAAAMFVRAFGDAIETRADPFVPTGSGPRRPREVVMPPSVDGEGEWEIHVGPELERTQDGRKFLLPPEDSPEARDFLRLAGVQSLEASAFFDLVESAGGQAKPAAWWYGCYAYMARHVEIARWTHGMFVGRRIVPTSRSVARVPGEASHTVLILPPRGHVDLPETPGSFIAMLEFVDSAVAELLWEGDEETRSWVTSRFHISTFEVTDFLPRVLQGAAPSLYTNEGAPTTNELVAIWRFVRGSIDAAAKPIYDEDVWQAVGRLPLPTRVPNDRSARVAVTALVPAFLSYFADDWLDDRGSLKGVEGLRRIASDFLTLLAPEEVGGVGPWRTFLERGGVSSRPKALTYRRIVPGTPLALKPDPPAAGLDMTFSGRRQQDENRVVLELITSEDLWSALAADAARCPRHPNQVVLSEATYIGGLTPCVAVAVQEHDRRDGRWFARLTELTREIAELSYARPVVTVCLRCSHEERAPGAAVVQLERQRWVPSTFGPWIRDGAFLRLAGHRFIGLAPGGEELGDRLLPYAIAETVDDYKDFASLGLAALDDPASASPVTLLRFLQITGSVLSRDAASADVIEVRARWRLVRGAIQEAYRLLNRTDGLSVPEELHLAVRTPDGPRFRPRPWYFAEPGSAVERAFAARLNIVDADRPYAKLFAQFGVRPLVIGEAVTEDIVEGHGSRPADRLHDQILGALARFLLALIVARSEDPQHAGLVVRRLRERFSVRSSPTLTLVLALRDESAKAEIPVESFYLRRIVTQSEDGGREAAYTLHAVGDAERGVFDVDADALGVALAPVFLEEPSDELAALFPRVVTRFQFVRGEEEPMRTFLLHQLGVSQEAQLYATELLHGEASIPTPGEASPPPRIVATEPAPAEALTRAREDALSKLRETYEVAQRRIAGGLAAAGGRTAHAGIRLATDGTGVPTPEQQTRGVRGEEELLRRLSQPDGWASFHLISDRRKDGCGYDFLCRDDASAECKLEVKTFVREGQFFVSLRELQEAQDSGKSYYLVGLCDNGGSPSTWVAYLLRNPIGALLRLGAFEIDTTLKVPSGDVFANEA